MKVKMFGETSVGILRKENQDGIFYDEGAGAGIVADGIGGRRGGDVASGIAVQEFAKFTQKNRREITARQIPDMYAELLEDINRKILAFGERYKDMSGLGTTATILQFFEEQLFIPHCGDSRAYLFVDDHLFQLTIDHNVSSSIKHGWLDPRSVPHKMKHNVLTRGLGLGQHLEIDVYRIKVRTGQIYMTCSDGLSDMVDAKTILRVIKDSRDKPDILPEVLVREACVQGGKDNVTVLIAEVT